MRRRLPTAGPDSDDRELLRELRSGGRAAFERLLDRYERRIYNLALRMLGDPTEAEDAAQDTFVEVHRSLPSFRGDSRLDTWIHRIAVNVCLQRRRKRSLPLSEMPEDLPSLLPGSDPFQAAVREELRSIIGAAVDRLPDLQRDVVVLHGIQGLSYSEAAEVLGCPVGTVKSRLAAAFKRLRELLHGYVAAEQPSLGVGFQGVMAANERE
jgi:RNA polymerase sigma-70 factor (ECF subfamily)